VDPASVCIGFVLGATFTLALISVGAERSNMLDAVKRLVRREPVRVAAVLAAVVVTVAQEIGLVLDEQSVGEYAFQVLVILGFAEAARDKVSPAA
jgi:hypothetical protein